jgi:hypothetical protein
MSSFRVGGRVKWTEAGRERLRGMPEAWGVHGAAARDEVGEVIEVIPPDADGPLRLSVEFSSGGVWNWDADCFRLQDEP